MCTSQKIRTLTKPITKWSRASGQDVTGLSTNCSIFQPFCEFLRIWSSFLSILLASKYLQPNFEVWGVLRFLFMITSCSCIRFLSLNLIELFFFKIIQPLNIIAFPPLIIVAELVKARKSQLSVRNAQWIQQKKAFIYEYATSITCSFFI